MSFFARPLLLLLLLSGVLPDARAQELPTPRSPQKAFALSLLLPGLGHRYAHGGNWRGAASVFAATDVSLWLGLLGTRWQRAQRIQGYETLAATRADALIQGKTRTFFLNLATYRSSDEFLDTALRNRAWDQVEYVSDRAYQWEWATEEDYLTFRDLREDAESLRRRSQFLVATLVANRLIAGLTALRAANRSAPDITLSLAPPLPTSSTPIFNVRFGF